MGYKIRQAQVNKIPYTLVVGDKEIAADQVTVRKYGEEATNTMAVTDFIKEISADVASYSRENN
jgi:threonyl-tRNA synthetase